VMVVVVVREETHDSVIWELLLFGKRLYYTKWGL
jgi:hypothetical protein